MKTCEKLNWTSVSQKIFRSRLLFVYEFHLRKFCQVENEMEKAFQHKKKNEKNWAAREFEKSKDNSKKYANQKPSLNK